MSREPWAPQDDQERDLLAAAVTAAEKYREAVDAADAAEVAMWAAIVEARRVVPDDVLCRHTRTSRSTLNRRYGTREES